MLSWWLKVQPLGQWNFRTKNQVRIFNHQDFILSKVAFQTCKFYLPWQNIERNEVWTVSQQLVAVVVKCVVNQFLNIFSESILNEATTVCQWALSHQCVATFSELPLFFFLLQNIIVKRKGILCQKEHAMNKLLPIFLQAVCCCKSVIKKANGEWHMAC